MDIKKTRILGSDYVGLFTITNESLCFVPPGVEEQAVSLIEKTLDVKTVKTGIYDSSLLAVFAKMNNKEIILPKFANPKEIETIEKEIKVRLIDTQKALGNLMAINDTHAILSQTLTRKDMEQISACGLDILQTNIGQSDATGSSLLLTNKGFLVNPNAEDEEIKTIQSTLKVNGGASTANTGDVFIRNSVLANTKGAIVGERTTGHEMNRIDEALEGHL